MENRYKEIRKLGEGASAQVYLVEEISTGKVYALKKSEKSGLLQQEAQILETLTESGFPKIKEYQKKVVEDAYKNGYRVFRKTRRFL